MKNTNQKFDWAVDNLFKNYFDDEQVNQLNAKINSTFAEYDDITSKINEFYQSQLNLKADLASDRQKIDRAITFSEKKLEKKDFEKFLLELGHICISSGKLNLANEIFKKVKNNPSSEKVKAEAILALSDIFSRRADWARSLQLIDEASIIYNNDSDNNGMSKCENMRGTIFGERGDFENAKQYFLNSLALINPEEDIEMAANLETNLGIIENIQGETEKSLFHLNNALAKYTQIKNSNRIAEVKLNIGTVLQEAGLYDLAEESLDEVIKIALIKGYHSTLCLAYLTKSQVLLAKKDFIYASEFADNALELGTSLDDKLTVADAYKIKGIVARYSGNFKNAEFYLLISLRMNTKLNNTMNIAETSFELGILYQGFDQMEKRDEFLNNSLSYFRKINARTKVHKIEELLERGIVKKNSN
jgi:tetratricopeptide (TPR) repeat protein